MKYSVLLVLMLNLLLYADGLFEDAGGDLEEKPYELNGYVRGTVYEGKNPDTEEAEMKSGYGEASMKFRIRKESWGDGFAEVRYRNGHEFGRDVDEFHLREAYVNAYVGPFDFRVGRQIVVWGRADGINPTNTITPQIMLVRSPDEDDRRLGNLLVRSFFTFRPVRLEAIWVPMYKSSVLPLHLVPLDTNIINITIGEKEYPDEHLKNSSCAFRLNLEMENIDGSISWFSGYNPLPGFDTLGFYTDRGIGVPSLDSVHIVPRAYRMQAIGLDFSTTAGKSLGLRGEAAYKFPSKDHEDNVYIPNPELHYVVGVDREYGNINILVQYAGKYIVDYLELQQPSTPQIEIGNNFTRKNRMFAFQQEETIHWLFGRLKWKLMFEALKLELPVMYNLTTEEYVLRPRVSYDIADALTATLGAEIYSGPSGTLFDMVGDHLGAGFFELKVSF